MSSFLPHTAQAKYYDKSHRVEKKLDCTLTSFGIPVPRFSVIFSSTTVPSKETTKLHPTQCLWYSTVGQRTGRSLTPIPVSILLLPQPEDWVSRGSKEHSTHNIS